MATKKYWKGLAERAPDKAFEAQQQREFPEDLPVDELFKDNVLQAKAPRRDFLKMLGFSATAATLAASCEIPVRKAIPYVLKPEVVTPGKASWYASSFVRGGDYCSILTKTREGRPIKIEGNPLSSITQGGTHARAQASVLSLYDGQRLKGPHQKSKPAEWQQVDRQIKKKLNAIRERDGKIAILTSTILSPSTRQVIRDFAEAYPNVRHVTYDANSCAAMLDANEQTFGVRAVPGYRFDKANVILSFDADFLSTWISPVEYTKQYSKKRKVSKDNPEMNHHVQVESMLSLTGSNADYRLRVHPSQLGLVLVQVYNKVARLAGANTFNAPAPEGANKKLVDQTVRKLWKNRGRSLVVTGINNVHLQKVTNALNSLLENYGKTVRLRKPSYQRQGSDVEVQQLIKDMKDGQVDALLVHDVNPAYSLPNAKAFNEGLGKVALSVSFNDRLDETTSQVQFACPDHHGMESWNDAEPRQGYLSLSQPTIAPLYDTRAFPESLLKWMDAEHKTYYHYIQEYWKANYFPRQDKYNDFTKFWNKVLHDGIFEPEPDTEDDLPEFTGIDQSVIKGLASYSKGLEGQALVLYEKTAMGDGRYANNPWLQEMPDPISKVTWDNYLAVSQSFAETHNLKNSIRQSKGLIKAVDTVRVKANGADVELPALIQPGIAENTVAVAIGYGRTKAGKGGNGVGKNVFPLARFTKAGLTLAAGNVSVEPAGNTYELAQTQTHHHLEGRPIVKETTLDEYKKDPFAGNEEYKDQEKIKKLRETTLYKPHKGLKEGHHWGMAIDLNACIGCGACTIACQAENNVPVVGKEEVKKHHEMHWIRIDRYYSDDPDNPEVVHQPMLCQHCDNAPCENVCPVAATNQSSEGLNQMAYNRCVGTRYCANNCPYKVRRFNWLDYTGADSFPWNENIAEGAMSSDLTRMVLNPDVVVRSRGVMEKCTFCVQRIQDSKLQAKSHGKKLKDGDIKTACQQGCPADAITFGDQNDKASKLSRKHRDERNYYALEILHTLPSVSYHTKVRNKAKEDKDTNTQQV